MFYNAFFEIKFYQNVVTWHKLINWTRKNALTEQILSTCIEILYKKKRIATEVQLTAIVEVLVSVDSS